MSILGATATIAAGAVTATVTGAFASTYQVSIAPGWVTDYDVVSKTATQFVVNFAVPAPAGGSTFDWVVSITAVATAQAITGATQTVAAGAVSAAFTAAASLPAAYQVMVSTSWVSGFDVVSKLSTGFTVNFAVPAPPGGGTVDITVFGPAAGTVSLADYLDELRDLLHDPSDRIWSALQKANYINRAMRQRDLDTGVNRQTFTFTLTAGTGTYTFSQVGSGSIFDVFSIVLIFGQTRAVLDNPSLTDLNIYYRPSRTQNGWTAGWAKQGPSTVIFGPTPSTAFVTEWDCAVYASPLILTADTDPLPYPYTKPVPFYAAHLAKINERNHADEAMEFLADYDRELGVATSARVGRIPNAYTGLGQPWLRR